MKLFEPRGRPLERREQHLPEQVPVDAYATAASVSAACRTVGRF